MDGLSEPRTGKRGRGGGFLKRRWRGRETESEEGKQGGGRRRIDPEPSSVSKCRIDTSSRTVGGQCPHVEGDKAGNHLWRMTSQVERVTRSVEGTRPQET